MEDVEQEALFALRMSADEPGRPKPMSPHG
jgi:hypothetical protein